MALKQFTICFDNIGEDRFLRNDEKYHDFLFSSDWNLFNTKNKKLIHLKDVLIPVYANFNFEEGEKYKGIPTGQSYIDEDGEIINHEVITLEDHPNRLKYKASNENILISSLRLAKSPALFFEKEDLSEYVFSNGFYIFNVRKNWNKKFIRFVLRTKRLKAILDNHIYRGIGISAFKEEDLLRIKIPYVLKKEQDKLVSQIEPIEKKIKYLKAKITPPRAIINKVFAEAFGLDTEKTSKIEQEKYFFISNDITSRNSNLRTSVRWNKIEPIQKILYENNPYINKLGKYITSTKNGWSPNCRETDTEYFVLGVNSISKDSVIKFDDLKTSNEQKTNLSEYYVKENDLFVSRGNTVDLVALASVVKNLPEDKYIIFPDLFIRIEVNDKELLKEYLAYLFNSIIGRFYFKYSAKGKNQTMVKISSEELNNFYLPVPPLNIQQKIIDEIKAELDIQEEIKNQIETERNKIDKIIEKAIS